MRLEDLPPKMRAQALAKLDRSPRAGARKSQKQASLRSGRWRCFKCGHESTAWSRAERHADETGHVRIETVLD